MNNLKIGILIKTFTQFIHSTFVILPKPFGPGGPRINLTNYSKFDGKVFKIFDLFKYQSLLLERQVREDDNSIISGYIEILDLSSLSLSLLAQFDLSLIKKMGVFAEKAQPTRIKGIHFINCPKEAATVLNLAKSLMPAKLQNRVSIKILYLVVCLYCISFLRYATN